MTIMPYHKQTVATKIANSFDKFANTAVTPTLLINHIRKLAGKDALITLARSDNVDPNTLNINAYYDPDADENEEKPFELNIVFNTNDKNVNLDRSEWREFATQVIGALKHEMIHQNQYRNRGYLAQRSYVSRIKDPVVKRSQEYLGHPDEVDAYSHDLAHEFIRKTKGDYEQVMRLLRNFSKTAMTKDQAGRLLSPNLFSYFKDFGFDTTHPVLKNLLKKTYRNVMMLKRKEERDTRVADRNYDIEKATEAFERKQEALDKQSGSSYTAIIQR